MMFNNDPDTWTEEEWTRRLELCCGRLAADGYPIDPMLVVEAINADHVTLDSEGHTILLSATAAFVMDAAAEIRQLTEGSVGPDA